MLAFIFVRIAKNFSCDCKKVSKQKKMDNRAALVLWLIILVILYIVFKGLAIRGWSAFVLALLVSVILLGLMWDPREAWNTRTDGAAQLYGLIMGIAILIFFIYIVVVAVSDKAQGPGWNWNWNNVVPNNGPQNTGMPPPPAQY